MKNNLVIPGKDTPRFVTAMLMMAVALLIGAIALLILLLNNRALATMDRAYMQKPDGSTSEIVQVDPNYRDPEVLKKTAEAFLQFMFEWKSKLPSGEKDEGVEVYGQTKVPSKVYLGSYLLEPKFRKEFLKKMGNEIIPKEVLRGTLESNLVIYETSEPLKVAPGQWEVKTVAARFDITDRGEQAEVTFRRKITLRAIRPQKTALLPSDKDSAFSESIRELLKNGLIVTNMVEG